MKSCIRYLYMWFKCLNDYLSDFNLYMTFNYNNPFRHGEKALLAKMLRQTHTIEKGMSIAKPRIGFGVSKINELIEMIDQYIEQSYDTSKTGFKNAISTMASYRNFQEKMGYKNKELFGRISTYEKLIPEFPESGIRTISLVDLNLKKTQSFENFMLSRHSVRQYSDTDIDVENIRKAVDLAKYAPTACNRQACQVYLYDSPKMTEQIGKLIAGNTGFASDVKRYLIITGFLSSFYDSFERNQIYVEAGIFTMSLVEALHNYGIASCVLQNGEHRKKQRKLKELCKDIGEDEKIIAFVAIGNYKDEVTYAVSNRKTVDEILKVY